MNQWNLVELHMEENRLRELSNFHHLENLQRLYLGMNRVQDMSELEKLEVLPNLIEMSVISNPVSRRLMHRPMLVYRQPNLLCIDGIPVSAEERTKAELYFMEQQVISTSGNKPVGMLAGMEGSLPGISSFKTTTAAPLKVTNMQLGTQSMSSDRHGWSTSIRYGPEDTQITTQPQESRSRQPQRGSGRGDAYGSGLANNVRVGYSSGNSSSSGRGQYVPHQIPYVPHHPPSSNSADNVYCGHNESLARLSNSNGRKRP